MWKRHKFCLTTAAAQEQNISTKGVRSMKRIILLVVLLLAAGLGAGQDTPKSVPDKLAIQVTFERTFVVDGQPQVHRDALYLPAIVTDPDMPVGKWLEGLRPEIERVKSERIAVQEEIRKHPPAPVEPTKEQMQAEVVEIDRQRASLESRKTELTAAIAAKVKEAEGKGK